MLQSLFGHETPWVALVLSSQAVVRINEVWIVKHAIRWKSAVKRINNNRLRCKDMILIYASIWVDARLLTLSLRSEVWNHPLMAGKGKPWWTNLLSVHIDRTVSVKVPKHIQHWSAINILREITRYANILATKIVSKIFSKSHLNQDENKIKVLLILQYF